MPDPLDPVAPVDPNDAVDPCDPQIAFVGEVEHLWWGRNRYVILRVPEELAAAARRQRTHRASGTIDGVAVHVGLNRADVIAQTFVYLGAATRDRLRVDVGDRVQCVLGPGDPDRVVVPDDVRTALEEAGRMDAFTARSPARRRQALAHVEAAVQPATRERRIDAIVASLPTSQRTAPPHPSAT